MTTPPTPNATTASRTPAKPKPVTARWLLNVAQFHLAQRIATERQVTEMLLRRAKRRSGAAPDETVRTLVAETVAMLLRAGLLDDKAYADARAATFKRKGLSQSAARMRLTAKGVGRDLAGDAVAEAGFEENEQIRMVARKLRIGPWARPGPVDDSDAPAARFLREQLLPEKDIARLARRGFSVAAIQRALKDVEAD